MRCTGNYILSLCHSRLKHAGMTKKVFNKEADMLDNLHRYRIELDSLLGENFQIIGI